MDNWNDDRLDELSNRVDEGFAKVDREMKEGFARVDQRFEGVATREEMGEVKAEIQLLNSKFDRLAHSLMVAGISFGISMFALLASLLVALIAG